MKVTSQHLDHKEVEFGNFEPIIIDFDNKNYWEHPLIECFKDVYLFRYHVRNGLGQILTVVIYYDVYDPTRSSAMDMVSRISALFRSHEELYYFPSTSDKTEPPRLGKKMLRDNDYAAEFFDALPVEIIHSTVVQVEYDPKRKRWIYKQAEMAA